MKKLCLILLALCLLFASAHAEESDFVPNAVDLYLPGNITTGFLWLATAEDDGVVAIDDQYFDDSADLGLMGAGGTHWFHFSGIAPGVTGVELIYARPWQMNNPARRLTVRLTVDERLNVLIWGFEMSDEPQSPGGGIASFLFTRGGYNAPVTLAVEANEKGDLIATINDEPIGPADDDFLAALSAAIENSGADGWNGYHGVMEGVLDGEGFALDILWKNGFSVTAHGDNMFPDGYYGFCTAVDELFGWEW